MIKFFKPMDCPICGEYYFSDDTEIEKNDPDYRGKSDDCCPYCGWKYDFNQFANPDLKNGNNVLSLNEFKAQFEAHTSENPDYDYEETNYVPEPHICPVCGKYEFPDTSSFDICPFCGWEDDEIMENDPDNWTGCSNDLSLNQYRERYNKMLSKNPNYKYSSKK